MACHPPNALALDAELLPAVKCNRNLDIEQLAVVQASNYLLTEGCFCFMTFLMSACDF